MIRTATPADLNVIERELPGIVAAMRATGNDQWGPAYPTIDRFAADLEAGHLFVDDQAGTVRGFAVFNETEPEVYDTLPWTVPRPAMIIHRLAVLTAFRRQGVADGLFVFAEAMAFDKHQGLRTDTSARNEPMLTLFAKRGWREVGTLRFPGRETSFVAWEKRFASPWPRSDPSLSKLFNNPVKDSQIDAACHTRSFSAS